MLPRNAIPDVCDRVVVNAKHASNRRGLHATSEQRSNSANAFRCEFGPRQLIAFGIAASRHSVSDVLRLRASAEMSWIYAGAVVARVKDALPDWDRAVLQFIRVPMSTYRPFVARTPESAVASVIDGGDPVPTGTFTATPIDLGPEPLFSRRTGHWGDAGLPRTEVVHVAHPPRTDRLRAAINRTRCRHDISITYKGATT